VTRMAPSSTNAESVVVEARGEVSDAERAYARAKVDHLRAMVPGPVLYARVALQAESNPARDRPAVAKAELDVNGQLVRAHVASGTMVAAIDLMESRLRQGLERLAHHEESKHLRHRGPGEHEWQHGRPAPARPPHFPRPVEEREVVRRKTFAVGEATPDEAIFDLELLDLDFYLFKNLETGEDNVITRATGAGYELIEPSPECSLAEHAAEIRPSAIRPASMSIDDALSHLNLGDEPFVFFFDPDSGRGRLLYRRYDGHYGLIVPADEPG
jgi:ribosome-associated translation inhibitor RaiA